MEVITGIDQSKDFKYKIGQGDNRQIASIDSYGYSIFDSNGKGSVSIDDPWAFDINGQSVPVHYTLNDGILTMTVYHQSGDYTYPIIADPCIRVWASNCWAQITEAISVGASVQSTNNAAAVAGAAGITMEMLWSQNPHAAASTGITVYVDVVVALSQGSTLGDKPESLRNCYCPSQYWVLMDSG